MPETIVRGNRRLPKAGTTAADKPVRGTKVPASAPRRARASTFATLANPQLASSLRKIGSVVSLIDAADVFGVTTQTVRKWTKAGVLPSPYFPPGYTDRKLYFDVSNLCKAIEKLIPRAT